MSGVFRFTCRAAISFPTVNPTANMIELKQTVTMMSIIFRDMRNRNRVQRRDAFFDKNRRRKPRRPD